MINKKTNKNTLNNLNLSFKKNRLNYFLAYLLTCVPGTLFFHGRHQVYEAAFLFVAFLFFFRRRKALGKSVISFFILSMLILWLQTYIFGRYSARSIVALIMYIFYPYFIIRLIGTKFTSYYVNIVYIICIISFIFYFPSWLFPAFHNAIAMIPRLLGTDYLLTDQNFIIFTWERSFEGIIRNSGNFTEPGNFAVRLNLALAFNLIETKKLINKKNIVLIIAIITTLSTGGYVVLFFLLGSYSLINQKIKLKIFIFPLLIFISVYAYTRLAFLDKKISIHYQTQVPGLLDKGRFGGARLDFEDIKEYPISGRGMIKATRFDDVDYWFADQAPKQTNGLTNFIVKYGIIGFAIYILLLIKSMKYYCKIYDFNKNYSYFLVCIVLLSAFGQHILLLPICISLLYFPDFILKKTLPRYYLSNLQNIPYVKKGHI